MKPLSSFFCFSLQTSTKLVCKSYLILVTMTMAINILKLDYEGPRKESVTALAVVLLFVVLLTGAAFTGHSGADREALCLVTTSLGLMVVAIILWIGLGIVSMQKGDPSIIWLVCLENRCTETFWTLDFSYRNSTSMSKDSLHIEKRKRPSLESKFDEVVHIRAVLSSNESYFEEMQKRDSRLEVRAVLSSNGSDLEKTQNQDWRRDNLAYNDVDGKEEEEIKAEEEEEHILPPDRVRPEESINFWSRITGESDESPYQDRKSGISLLITLVFFLLGFVYFFTCVTIVCSYSAELYEEYSSYEVEDEDDTSVYSL